MTYCIEAKMRPNIDTSIWNFSQDTLYPQIIFVKDIKLKSDINIMETNGDIYGRSMGIIKDIDQFREGELLIPV